MKLEINHRKINEEKITKKLSGMLPKKKKPKTKKQPPNGSVMKSKKKNTPQDQRH